MQHDLQPLELARQIGVEDRVAERTRHRIDDRQLIDAVAEIVHHPHGVAENRLGVEVGLLLILHRAVRRHQIAQIERQRRMAVGGRMALARNLLVLERGVLDRLHQIEIDACTADAGNFDIGRGQGDRRAGNHPVEQKGPERAADRGDGGVRRHGRPLPWLAAARPRIGRESARPFRLRPRRGRSWFLRQELHLYLADRNHRGGRSIGAELTGRRALLGSNSMNFRSSIGSRRRRNLFRQRLRTHMKRLDILTRVRSWRRGRCPVGTCMHVHHRAVFPCGDLARDRMWDSTSCCVSPTSGSGSGVSGASARIGGRVASASSCGIGLPSSGG